MAVSKEIWAKDLLKGLDIPFSENRAKIFYAWFNGEGTVAKYNPLATTWVKQGSTFFNCLKRSETGKCIIGVQNYPDYKTGLKATLDTLKQDFYIPIIEAIEKDVKKFNPKDKELIKAFATWGTGYANWLRNYIALGGSASKGDSKDKNKTLMLVGGAALLLLLLKDKEPAGQ